MRHHHSRDIEIEVKGLTFTLRGRDLFLEDQQISFRDFFLFVRGKIDLAPKPSIVDIVLDASGTEGLDTDGGDFDILREALSATGLVSTLDNADADFTVFAPTDAAFIELARSLGADIADGDEQGALTAILTALEGLAGSAEGGLDLLKDILLFHVAPNGKTLAQLQAAGVVTTAQGGTITVDGTALIDAEPDIANPSIVAEDIAASNGTVQVIDRVLLPIDIPGNDLPNIVDIASGNADFEILVKALAAAGLVETVRNLDDITVFAPTDAAFTQLASDLGFGGDTSDEDAVFGFIAGALGDLGGGDPIPLLTDILLYHVSPDAKSANQIDGLDEVETLLTDATFATEGTELIDNEPDIANPNIVIPDIAADNGTIQAIDRVLIPFDIPGNEAGQILFGTRGRDELTGGGGDDKLFGRAGSDQLLGLGGDDVIRGGKGVDRLFGGEGDDRLSGGLNSDLLDGGAGDDVLIGGWGKDYFDFRTLSGDDVAHDHFLNDRVIFSKDDFATFEELHAATSFQRYGAVISGDEGSVTLAGVREHEFSEHLFIFT